MEKVKIGENSRKVWQILIHARKVSVKELCSLTCLNIDDVMLAVGWLAKENSSFYRKESRFFLCQRRFWVLLLLRI